MRYAVLVVGILGSLAAGVLGLLWLMDKNSAAGLLLEALRREQNLLDATALAELKQWDRHVMAMWLLFAAVPLGVIGAVLGFCRRGLCGAVVMLLAAIGPALFDWRSLIFTFPLIIAAALSCFVRRPTAENETAGGRRSGLVPALVGLSAMAYVAVLAAIWFDFLPGGTIGTPPLVKGKGVKDKDPQVITAKGRMPKKDPAREAERAAAREKVRLALADQETKIVEALKKWPGYHQESNGSPIFLQFQSGNDLKDYVQGAALSPNGSTMLLHTWDGEKVVFRVIDLVTAKEVCRINASKESQLQHAFSPDGARVAIGGFDRQITIYDLANGQVLKKIPMNRPIWDLAYSPDGKRIAAAAEGSLMLIDPESGQITKTLSDIYLNASRPAFSPAGDVLVATHGIHNDHLGLWDTSNGGKIEDLNLSMRLESVKFTPDGWKLLVRGNKDSKERIVLVDLETKDQKVVAEKPSIGSAAMSPDGKYVAFLSYDKGLFLAGLEEQKEMSRRSNGVGKLIFFPGGTLVATFENGRLGFYSVADLLTPPPPKEKIKDLADLRKWASVSGPPDDLSVIPNEEDVDATLAQLKIFPGITRLNLAYRRELTDAGLAHLKDLPKLEELDLSNARITDAGVAHLRNVPTLKSLRLSFVRNLSDDSLKHLASLKQLKSLSLSHVDFSNEGLAHLKDLRELRELEISSLRLNDEGLAHIAGLTELVRLRLVGSLVTDAGLAYLKDMKKLSQLDIAYCKQIRGTALAKLTDLKDLTEFKLVDTEFNDDVAIYLKNFRKLKDLELGGTKITDAALENLKGLGDLEFLTLDVTGITDLGLDKLHGLTNLRTLSVGETKVTNAGIERLKKANPKLFVQK